jgi:hypothetical protein
MWHAPGRKVVYETVHSRDGGPIPAAIERMPVLFAEAFGWWEVLLRARVGWRYSIRENGVLFVMTVGI